MMASRPPRSRRVVLTIVGLLLLALTGGTLYLVQHQASNPESYQPTAAEQPMFDHLRPATDEETKQGRNVVTRGLPDNPADKMPEDVDVYVAKSDFHTTYTAHPMAIMMRPGVKWLGGKLGNIVLIMRQSHSEREAKEVRQMVDGFSWASAVYDPFCRAYNLGYATLDACKGTAGEASTQEVKLTPVTVRDVPYGFSEMWLPSGRNLSYDWSTPSATTTALRWTEYRESKGTVYLPVTFLKKGQKLTGGEFGARQVILPVTQQDGVSPSLHVTLEDTIRAGCTGGEIQGYLGDAVKAKYKACA